MSGSTSTSPVFFTATAARNSSLPREVTVHDEIRAIESAVLASINQGVYTVTVSNGTKMTYSNTVSPLTWTIDYTTGHITIINHPFNTGDTVKLNSTGTLPSGLTSTAYYYVVYIDTNTIMLASSYTNATLARPITVSVTDNGSGTLNMYYYPPSLDYFAVLNNMTVSNTQLSAPYSDQMNAVTSYFTNLGYSINQITNTTTNNTFSWVLQW